LLEFEGNYEYIGSIEGNKYYRFKNKGQIKEATVQYKNEQQTEKPLSNNLIFNMFNLNLTEYILPNIKSACPYPMGRTYFTASDSILFYLFITSAIPSI
jgi:hypothetical protein